MNYRSTRDAKVSVPSAVAISKGISEDGGLFVPEYIPTITAEEFETLKGLDYIGRAKAVLAKYLDDFTAEEIDYCVNGAYKGTFDNDQPAPLYKLDDGKYVLELWHGPTCAFKDLALQLLPFLLTTAAKKVGKGKSVILVATSGDTGKAALEGFCDVPNTEIIVFYPNNGVSPMQKLQMDTQKGENVYVCSINGNFDDAQSGVKKIFTDANVKETLRANGMEFSSANSINWGRLVPQIVYYVSAYCDLLNKGENLRNGFNVVVPTGNFGNILAAFYAKCMGVPIAKLVCASNANNVLTDFINTGVYDRNRKFYTTISPSMDILISSNLERMVYHLCGNDACKTALLQKQLAETGKYTLDAELLAKLREHYFGGCCDDSQTLDTIKKVFEDRSYLSDTHTAVALKVADEYTALTSDNKPTVIASTASPYKFSASVLKAVAPDKCCDEEFKMVEELKKATKTSAPAPIEALKNATPRFDNVCESDEMVNVVLKVLGL
ncbi:MAG: threonine synthase [Ruminococcaceae bacterium]|nr:threonine synthase [Oscillospiraceae bacterium]